MVDAVISYVLNKVGDYLIQEVVSFQGVKREVESLKNDLILMQCFIKDAMEKQVEDDLLCNWVSIITDIAYDAEDVFDTFMLKVRGGRTLNLDRRRGAFTSFMKCSSCINDHQESSVYRKCREKGDVYGIGKGIEAIRKRIKDLVDKRGLYGIQEIDKKQEGKSKIALDKLKELRRVPSFVVEENVVGFEDDADKLLAKVLEKEPRRLVISICGMGGLGKTTLAKKMYHNIDVRSKFDCYGWVVASQDCRTRDLVLGIIESFKIKNKKEMEKIVKMSKENLEREFYSSLQGRSYLVVIDDVWKKEAWESLKRAFPDNKNGSRVIITTRNKEVAERIDDVTHVHELRFLRPNESWKLFCDKAFRNSKVDKGLEKLGREMVGKCGGLPLAIVVLGGLLSTKKPHEWGAVRDQIWRHLQDDSIDISNLLALSYNDLPYPLKLCFLYIGLFPEDFLINFEKLVRLLVAEGFTWEAKGQIMEDVAENYVNKLINRSLVQVDERCWGRITTCRVHDLLRDLAVKKAEELNFVHICDELKHSSTVFSVASSCRRHAIYSESEKFLWLQHCNPSSRSLLFFNQRSDLLTPLYSKFSYLRILEVEVFANSLPKEIGKLIHFTYLGLRGANLYNLPPSIVNLQRLQTLELNSFDRYVALPTEISKLQELRHLTGFFTGSLPIASLKNLLTLKYVCFVSWARINPKKLVNLRELQIELGGGKEKDFSLDSIATLRSLRILSVWLGPDQSFNSLQPLGHCPCLVDLRLNGKLQKLPTNMDQLLPNLQVLKLSDSLLDDDPMPTLEKLPSLMFLVLIFGSYEGKKMMCRANGFPRLEILQLELFHLEEWQVDEAAMPMLRGLSIKDCFSLKIPERLESIPLPGEFECIDRLSLNNSKYFEL
ncbi:putative disease resistance RPP13-like protein 3 [Pistacia vera]|uniref:putative disease resistance RPP13-like protein 3 n=1 Tax=Pistacia vera TaxID=55513 RepID=UPI001262C65D|nr:putative disease resistance RPP13-like protein 3 [Pistacia vera]XP_031259586.1 putative disease resistance RPP13-like protein 3 [Pistacia vera]